MAQSFDEWNADINIAMTSRFTSWLLNNILFGRRYWRYFSWILLNIILLIFCEIIKLALITSPFDVGQGLVEAL